MVWSGSDAAPFFHRESPKRFSGKTPCGFLKNMYLCNVNFKKEVI